MSEATSYSHCPQCGQPSWRGQLLCGHQPERKGEAVSETNFSLQGLADWALPTDQERDLHFGFVILAIKHPGGTAYSFRCTDTPLPSSENLIAALRIVEAEIIAIRRGAHPLLKEPVAAPGREKP
jgi:hypothetical protein